MEYITMNFYSEEDAENGEISKGEENDEILEPDENESFEEADNIIQYNPSDYKLETVIKKLEN
jgi:hypothetical protein